MFNLSGLQSACYELLEVPMDEPSKHDIWLGGFDFFIQYIHRKMEVSTEFNRDDFENVAAWLRDYYSTHLQNVRVMRITYSLADRFITTVAEEKHFCLRKIVTNILAVGWNDNCAAVKLCIPPHVEINNGQLHEGSFNYTINDLSTCDITIFPSKRTNAENSAELLKLNEKERLNILLLAYHSVTDETLMTTCKIHPDLYGWAQKIDILSARAAFRIKHSHGLLCTVAYLERNYSTHCYLSVVERAQFTEVFIDLLKERTMLIDEDKPILYKKFHELTNFFNHQPNRATNPIGNFPVINSLNCNWTNEVALCKGFTIYADGTSDQIRLSKTADE